MNQKSSSVRLLLLVTVVFVFICISFTVNRETEWKVSDDPKIANLKLPAGFHADHLYGPSLNGEGSWVSMTFDSKGRIIASDQYGGLYRLRVPAIGDTVNKTEIESLKIFPDTVTSKDNVSIGYAHGLLWAFNSLYVMINNKNGPKSKFKKGSGLYRMQDTNGDDQFDKVTLLKALAIVSIDFAASVASVPPAMAAKASTRPPPIISAALPVAIDKESILKAVVPR